MGYSTTFEGELKFTVELMSSDLAHLSTILGEDCREHPEWDVIGLTYVDLTLLKDFSGLKWNGSEKTYDLIEKTNLVIRLMKERRPDFNLEGKLIAQGESFDDRWALVMENETAVRRDIIIEGRVVECPNCGDRFVLE